MIISQSGGETVKVVLLKGNGIIAPHIIEDYSQAFTNQGHENLIINLDQHFSDSEYQTILNFKPDFILAYGFKGIIQIRENQYLFRASGIPLVCLHYDNPFFGINDQLRNEFTEYSSYYYHFVWDQYFLNLLKEQGIKNVYSTMLAVNPSRIYPDPNILTSENSLSFVGSLGELERANEDENLEQLFIEFIIHQKINNIDIPVHQLCRQALQIKEFHPINTLFEHDEEIFWKQIYYEIHKRGSTSLRHHVLDSIGGIDLHVYGGYKGNKSDIIAHPPFPYNQISSVYQKHAVNLNISSLQLETSVNNRVFDVFASRAFVLSDYKADMQMVFPEVWEDLTYRNLEDLVIKADYFLTHPKERTELVDNLYHHIIENHTYEHRVAEVVEVMKSSLRRDHSSIANGTVKNKYKQQLKECPICKGVQHKHLYSIEGHNDFETNLHRCVECGAVFMNPQPTEEYLDWFYNKVYYSKDHRRKMGWDENIGNVSASSLRNYEVRMDLVESFINQTRYPRGVLLDIGSATGNFLMEAQSRYWTVQGLEVSEDAAQQSMQNYGINTVTGVMNEHLFEDESFDVVTAWDVIEHISDPHDFMANIRRVLKPDGIFAANTPNVNSTASFHSGSQWRHLDPPLHVILYDYISLRVLLKMHGFEILKISSGSEYLGQLQVVAKKI